MRAEAFRFRRAKQCRRSAGDEITDGSADGEVSSIDDGFMELFGAAHGDRP